MLPLQHVQWKWPQFPMCEKFIRSERTQLLCISAKWMRQTRSSLCACVLVRVYCANGALFFLFQIECINRMKLYYFQLTYRAPARSRIIAGCERTRINANWIAAKIAFIMAMNVRVFCGGCCCCGKDVRFNTPNFAICCCECATKWLSAQTLELSNEMKWSELISRFFFAYSSSCYVIVYKM